MHRAALTAEADMGVADVHSPVVRTDIVGNVVEGTVLGSKGCKAGEGIHSRSHAGCKP